MAKDHIYVLGINAYDHDVSACLLRDGAIAYAIAKERVTREKHDTGFYEAVIDYCLKAEGITLDDVALIVRNCYVLPVEDMDERLAYEDVPDFMDTAERRQAAKSQLYLTTSDKVVSVSHHVAHAYSAFAACPFEEGAVMVVDGVGNYCVDIHEPGQLTDGVNPLARESESFYRFDGAKLETLKKVWLEPTRGFLSDEFFFMPGLGALYSRVSSYIFADWNKCGEVMGLAPYGRPEKIKPLAEMRDGALDVPEWTAAFSTPWLPDSDRDWEKSRYRKHWEDLAWRVQDDTETVLLARAKWLRETTGAKNLCIAGGVGLNCVANGRLARESGFDNVWIQPASGDDGIAIGCAYYGHLQLQKQPRSFVMDHAYLGRAYADKDIEEALSKGLARLETAARRSDDICAEAAKLLADGNVLGWFQGRSEFGPRALGNRSILADPRLPAMKDTLNARVKHRQAFRPFAPIVLAERAKEIFEGDEEFSLHAHCQARAARMEGQDPGDRACRRHRACADGARGDQRAASSLVEGVRGADRGAGADQHLFQREGRADRRDAARCGRMLPVDGYRPSGRARNACRQDRLPPGGLADHGHVLGGVGDGARRPAGGLEPGASSSARAQWLRQGAQILHGGVREHVAVQPVAVAEDSRRRLGVEHGRSQPIERGCKIVSVVIDEAPVALYGRVQEMRKVLEEVLTRASHVGPEHQDAQLGPLLGREQLVPDLHDARMAGLELDAGCPRQHRHDVLAHAMGERRQIRSGDLSFDDGCVEDGQHLGEDKVGRGKKAAGRLLARVEVAGRRLDRPPIGGDRGDPLRRQAAAGVLVQQAVDGERHVPERLHLYVERRSQPRELLDRVAGAVEQQHVIVDDDQRLLLLALQHTRPRPLVDLHELVVETLQIAAIAHRCPLLPVPAPSMPQTR